MSRKEVLVIESFAGDYAVIKYGAHTFTLPRYLLPRAAKEGDILKLAVALEVGYNARRKSKPVPPTSKL
jgi:hypothetical protein